MVGTVNGGNDNILTYSYSHAQEPKYRCPGCTARTCSLACYKRHQKRVSCNGKRDPSTFVKKSQLATPAGIDRDYNYLRDVERTIKHGSQDLRDRGVGIDQYDSKNALRGWQPGSSLQQYLVQNHITVHRAPAGLSRQKNNTTRVTKSGNVVWTVEWIDDDLVTLLQQDCAAQKTIAELYAESRVQRINASLRRAEEAGHAPSQRGKKRKRAAEVPAEPVGKEEPIQLTRLQSPELTDTLEDLLEQQRESRQANFESHVNARVDSETKEASKIVRSEPPSNRFKPKKLTEAQRAVGDNFDTTTEYYYLLKPNTRGHARVVIALDPQASLTAALDEQVLLEYPTIYVLSDPIEDVPEHLRHPLENDFLLENQYIEALRGTGPPARTARLGSMPVQPQVPVAGDEQRLDAQSILDMLKRDVAT